MKKLHIASTLPENRRVVSKTLSGLIDASAGRIVTIDFLAADGTIKTINGRTGVRKHVKGVGKTADSNLYVTLYKMQAASVQGSAAKHYRTIRRDSIVAIRGLNATVNAY